MIAIVTLAICSAGMIQSIMVWRRTKNRLHLLHIPVNFFGILSFGTLYFLLQQGISIRVGVIFYLLLSLVFPFLLWWANEFTRRMRTISSTGDFELGLPMPSASYQLLGALGHIVQQLAKPIVVVQGPQKINQKISDLSKDEPAFGYMHENADGSFVIDPRVVPLFRMTDAMKERFVLLVDFLIDESALMAGRMSRKELQSLLRGRVQGVIERYSDLLIGSGLLDRLGGGIFSDSISTGLAEFDLNMEGGYPEHAAILICGPPSDERNLVLDSFIGTGLTKGDPCMYVSSAQPPENVITQFGDLGSQLTIVDCYSNRIREVSTITREGNIITSPIEISVVSVAISRVLDKERERTKRAVVDILPTYLVFQTVEKLYLDLMEIIDEIRRAGYTALFSLNPYYIKDEGAISTLQELFDGIVYVERTADSAGMRDEVAIRVDKMAGKAIAKAAFKFPKPSIQCWDNVRERLTLTGDLPHLADGVEA